MKTDKMIGVRTVSLKRVSLYVKCLCLLTEEEVADLFRTTIGGIFCVCECVPNDPRASQPENQRIFTIRKLSTCFVPDMVFRCLDTGRTALHFRDLLFSETAGYIADSCTVVTTVQPNCRYSSIDNHYERTSIAERNGFKFVDDDAYTLIANSKSAPIPLLSRDTKAGELVLFCGDVHGVNDEHAAVWNICSNCKSNDIVDDDKNLAFCISCQERRPVETKMELEIYLRSRENSDITVALRLLKESISSLLAGAHFASFQQHDVSDLLEKRYGPVAAYCRDTKVVLDPNGVEMIEVLLEEVKLYADSP